MKTHVITAVWKDEKGVITHYNIHEIKNNEIYPSVKISKAEAITLIKKTDVKISTAIWNYEASGWTMGEEIKLVRKHDGTRFLRTVSDSTQTDNLGHLIDLSIILMQ